MLRSTSLATAPILTGIRYASTSQAPPRTRRVPLRRLAIPLFLVSAVSSLAINVRNARDTLEQLESSHSAQRSVLLDLIQKLEKGSNIGADEMKREFERVGIIQRQLQKHERSIGWKETIFGRRKTADELQTEQDEIKQIEESFERANGNYQSPAPSQSTPLTEPLVSSAKGALPSQPSQEPPQPSAKNQGIFI